MTTLSVRIPDEMHSELTKHAETDRISINSAIVNAVEQWNANRQRERQETAALRRILIEDAELLDMLERRG
jgi:hypothetical protein